MKGFGFAVGTAVSAFCLVTGAVAGEPQGSAEPSSQPSTVRFTVMRDGDQIGTTTVKLRREGAETIAEIEARIAVKIAFVTVYRFEQNETEHWLNGQLVSLKATTNDNGTTHTVAAKSHGNKLLVEADGKTSEVDRALMPSSLWNAALVQKTRALNVQDGTVIPLNVVDHGDEQVDYKGKPTKTRHYSITMSFPQDVWYDQNRQLVKVRLLGSDGSKIEYRPG